MTREAAPKLVIFDTDMGSDDAWALQMMIKAEKLLGNIKILAITTVSGNTTTDNVIKNTFRILDGLNRIDIPIYKGAIEGIIPVEKSPKPFFGRNGFSDVEFWQPHYPSDINSIIQSQHAVEGIRDLILKHPHQIYLFGIGPLTNIALAVKTYPEIREKIKEVFIMGGNHKGRGNVVPGAEFNFHADPIAAYIVLNSLKCPMTIVTLECGLEESINIPLDWRFQVLGNCDDNNVQLLNEIERIAFRERTFFTPFDAILTAAFLFPESIKIQNQYHATVELQGTYTRGQMIIDRRNNDHNVTIIETVNEDELKRIMQWTASA